ncbi:MAG: heavy metal translocating P-type ATPase [Treponema sp.]
MNIRVKHSLPGRLRLHYTAAEVSPRQAVLAETMIAVQSGIINITVNPKICSFLIYYDVNIISEKEVLNLFTVLSGTYLNDKTLLSAVSEVPATESIFSVLIGTLFTMVTRSFLPMPVRHILLYKRIIPRIFKAAESILAGKVFSTDLLDAAALTAAVLDGKMSTARSIAVLLDMGEEIEELTRRQSYSNLAQALLISNEPVHIVEGDEERSIPASALKADDYIVVRAGSQIPADGDVEKGEGLVNQASITGEPLPVEKNPGSTVFAGTLLAEGELYIRVRTVGTDTKVNNIISMIDRSQHLKAAAQKRSEQMAERIVPFNFLLTGLTYLFTRDTAKTISTLMVDYSCAMKLAAPIAMLSAMKEAAEHGISVKGGKFLEEAALADTVIFDKTGTLTYAEPVLAEVYPIGIQSKDEVLRLAACLEEHFPHPLGRAVVKAAQDHGLVHPERHAKVEYIVAHGIVSTLDGKRMCIGSAHFIFDDEHIPLSSEAQSAQKAAAEKGYSLLYLAVDGTLAGILAIGDPVRENAAETVDELRRLGVKNCVMITGDAEQAAAKIAAEAGITEYHAQALPEDKVAYVQTEIQAGRKVIMIGDGINDAPALSAASAGIAMDSCSSIAGDTADIVLSGDGLESLVTVRRLGQGALRRIGTNNKRIIGGNSLLLFGGMFGLIPPAAAAVLHNSLTVGISIQSMQKILKEHR